MASTPPQTVMEHILEVVFALKPDSPIHCALEQNAYRSPIDFLMESDDIINDLKYTDDNKKKQPLERGHAGLIKIFKQFVAHQVNQGVSFSGDAQWKLITKEQFDDFRISNANSPTPIMTNPHPNPSTVASSSTVRTSTVVDLVREFKRGIKRDITQFTPLKDDTAWDNWNRSTTAQARAQDIADILDPTYSPSNPDEIALFMEKQKFMYAVFEKTLLTDKGKALVRQYQHTFDAQSIYRDLSAYAMLSTKAAIQASSLLSHITTVTLGDGHWKGTTHAFILHWQDQVRKYHDMNPQNIISPDLQCTMLQNAVHPIMELRQVKLNAQQLKTFTGKDLSYDEYCSLLLSAAQQYDNQMRNSGKIAKRRVYDHEIYHNPMDDQDTWYDASYDIDLPVADLQIHATNFQQGPRLSYEQWHALPDDAKKIWDTLSAEAKTIIL